MTYKKACQFFFKYGMVGRNVEDLLKKKPTEAQLEAACIIAFTNGQSDLKIKEAKDAILNETCNNAS